TSPRAAIRYHGVRIPAPMSYMSALVTARSRVPSQNSTLTESPARPERPNRTAASHCAGACGVDETPSPAETDLHPARAADAARQSKVLVVMAPSSSAAWSTDQLGSATGVRWRLVGVRGLLDAVEGGITAHPPALGREIPQPQAPHVVGNHRRANASRRRENRHRASPV